MRVFCGFLFYFIFILFLFVVCVSFVGWGGAEQDCVQSEGKLYLIFEFVDRDLKKYMEATQGMLDPMLVKVGDKKRKRKTFTGKIRPVQITPRFPQTLMVHKTPYLL